MTITSKSTRVDTNKMEWKFGGANLMNQYDSMKKLDSDDESDNDIDPQEYLQNNPEFMKNPLKILASRSEVPNHKKSHASYIAEVEKATIDKGKDDLGMKIWYKFSKGVQNEIFNENAEYATCHFIQSFFFVRFPLRAIQLLAKRSIVRTKYIEYYKKSFSKKCSKY